MGNLVRPERGQPVTAQWGQTVTDMLQHAPLGGGGVGSNGTVIDVLEANEDVTGDGAFEGLLTQFKDGDWEKQVPDKETPISKRFTEGFLPEEGLGIFWMNNVAQIQYLLTTGALLTWGQLTGDWNGDGSVTVTSDIPLKGVADVPCAVWDPIKYLKDKGLKLVSGNTIVFFFVDNKWTLIGSPDCPVKTEPDPVVRGAIIFHAGPPDDAWGIDGDGYYDTTNHDWYGPKASGAWPATPFDTGPA